MPSPLFRNKEKAFGVIAIYTPPIMGVIALIITTYFKLVELSVVAATLTSVLSVLSLTILGNKNLRMALQYADETQWSVKKHLHATPIGSPEKALEYVSSRLPVLKEVKNTSFNTKNVDIVDLKFYTKSIYKSFCDSIVSNCIEDLVWTDIGDRYSISRFRKIRESCAIKSHGKTYRYAYRLLPDSCPHMNFIILYYKDNSSDNIENGGNYAEVLFNWDFRSTESDPIVYMSTDRELVSMYSVHFNTMLSAASQDHDAMEELGAL